MKTATICLSLTLSALSAPLFAHEGVPSLPEHEKSEWIELFDGKSIDAWEIKGSKAEYKVEDGAIVGIGKDLKGNSFLCTKERFTDFEFQFEMKFDHLEGNSGVMFRANQKESENGNGRVFGYQCEHDNRKDRAWTAGLYDEARRGWLYPVQKDSDKVRQRWFTGTGVAHFNWEGWNTITIRCQGNHIQTWMNGIKRVDFIDTDKKNDTREGFIGLQVHGGKSCQVRWKNLKLRKL